MANTEFMEFANQQMATNISTSVDFTQIMIGVGVLAASIALLVISIMSVRTLLELLTLNHMKANGITKIVKHHYPKRYVKRHYRSNKRYSRRR